MTGKNALIVAAVMVAGLDMASARAAPPVAATTPADAATMPPREDARAGTDPVVVTGRPVTHHRVMRALFGRRRRHGGFFKNLFHGRSGPGHNRACKRRFRSYDPRTNRYRAYSGVRRVCLL